MKFLDEACELRHRLNLTPSSHSVICSAHFYHLSYPYRYSSDMSTNLKSRANTQLDPFFEQNGSTTAAKFNADQCDSSHTQTSPDTVRMRMMERRDEETVRRAAPGLVVVHSKPCSQRRHSISTTTSHIASIGPALAPTETTIRDLVLWNEHTKRSNHESISPFRPNLAALVADGMPVLISSSLSGSSS